MIYPIRSIVAGVATVDEPDPLMVSALELAARTGAMLHLVHAFELPGLVWDAYAQMGMLQPLDLDGYARDLRARLVAQVREASAYDRVRVEVVAGPPAPMILAAATRERAELILVGATRRGAFARAILGTTAQRVLRGAPVPVLIVRDRLPNHLMRVLVATDLSEFSAGVHEIGLDVVTSLFGEDQPELRSLHVVPRGGELPLPVQHELLHEATRRCLATFVEQRRARTRAVEPAIRYGDPATEIAAEVAQWRADLLVVGTHGRRGPTRWVLGSVAESTIRSARSGILVIPAMLEEVRSASRRPRGERAGSVGPATSGAVARLCSHVGA